MHTIFLYMPETHNTSVIAERLRHRLVAALLDQKIVHKSRWFWDDNMGYERNGVRLDVEELMSDSDFKRLLGEIVLVATTHVGAIEVKLDQN